jgi:hypothetical protein
MNESGVDWVARRIKPSRGSEEGNDGQGLTRAQSEFRRGDDNVRSILNEGDGAMGREDRVL